jgi:transcriptional antiterminator NusG
MKNWYALFVKTGDEDLVNNYIQDLFLKQKIKICPFITTVERIIKLPGIVKIENYPLFLGYLFIDTDAEPVEFYSSTQEVRPYLTKIIRVLRQDLSFEILLKPEEKQCLDALLNKERCLKVSKGYIEDSELHITEGPLKGKENIIRKIDRHKRKALIEIAGGRSTYAYGCFGGCQ